MHETNFAAFLRPELNHDLYAIAATAWWCGSLTARLGQHGCVIVHSTLICAQADEFERLADADEELAARIRGAPQITVCAAPIACGKADGQLVHDRLARLAAGEALAGRPAPLVRCVLARAQIIFHNSACR